MKYIGFPWQHVTIKGLREHSKAVEVIGYGKKHI